MFVVGFTPILFNNKTMPTYNLEGELTGKVKKFDSAIIYQKRMFTEQKPLYAVEERLDNNDCLARDEDATISLGPGLSSRIPRILVVPKGGKLRTVSRREDDRVASVEKRMLQTAALVLGVSKYFTDGVLHSSGFLDIRSKPNNPNIVWIIPAEHCTRRIPNTTLIDRKDQIERRASRWHSHIFPNPDQQFDEAMRTASEVASSETLSPQELVVYAAPADWFINLDESPVTAHQLNAVSDMLRTHPWLEPVIDNLAAKGFSPEQVQEVVGNKVASITALRAFYELKSCRYHKSRVKELGL
jgi:hypothetical protein